MSDDSQRDSNVSQLELELYFLIAKFLSNGPCSGAAEVLKKELAENKLLLKRIDWEGNEHFRSYQNLVDLYRHIAPDHLFKVCERLCPLLDKEVKPSVSGVVSLLGAGRQSALRTQEDVRFIQWPGSIHSATYHGRPLAPPHNLSPVPNLVNVLDGRNATGVSRFDHVLPTKLYSKVGLLSRSLGHLSAVYCVMFDGTGQYIFTGADDNLVKIWSSVTGRLLATLRGHAAEITDMAVNYENTILAVGSCDKLIRVWCLATTSPVAVLHGHTGMITSLSFCPYVRGDHRYLLSTGGDGCVCFWHYNAHSNKFNSKPIKFIERSRAGAQMLCSSFSPGGVFLATGSSDHVLRVYCFTASAWEKIGELESHTDRVDSIQYANKCLKFISGSKDGTARLWRFERQEWKALVLNMNQKIAGAPNIEPEDRGMTKLKVTMVGWTSDDKYAVTAVTDLSVKVWDSLTGKLVYNLMGHEDEVFVLESNPVDSRILLTAGHDGRINLWDLTDGTIIKTHYNNIQGQGHGAVFDTKWAPDGQSFAATDSHGFLRYFGHGSADKYKRLPEEMFFHTDYRPLIRDANSYVLDEQTQQPPHLMPPPFLVDIDGNPHPSQYQRLVPGREKASENSLVPEMGVTPSGNREVLGDAVEEEPVAGPSQPPPPPPPPAPAPAAASADEPALIDELIARMQRSQDERISAAGGAPLPGNRRRDSVPDGPLSPSSRTPGNRRRDSVPDGPLSPSSRGPDGPLSPSVRGPRRSGNMQGVRQSSGNVPVSHRANATDLVALSRRVVVRELNPVIVKTQQKARHYLADEEIKAFVRERKKKPLPHSENDSSDSNSYMRTRKRQRARGSRSRPGPVEETGRNRLTTRALYDTEEEEDSNQSTQEEVHESEEHVWNSDSSDQSESSEYSDWAEDGGGVNLQPPKRQSQRQPKKKRISSSEEEEDENDSDDDQPGPSTSAAPSQPKPKKSKPPPKRNIKRERQQKKILDVKADLQELPEEFKPPEWLSATIPRKAPYFPQMGDELMYFRQGHEQYVQAVKARKVYEINVNKNQPWHKIPQLREQELVKVVGIKYEIRPPRLVCLKLAFIDHESGKMTGGTFSIKYHDMPDVIDFLVLRQTYDTAKERNWKVGDLFRSLIDDAWWMGKIESQGPFQEEYPDSMFQCFTVHWDNGEVERMSPWDLELLDDSNLPASVGGSIPVTPEELKSLQYEPKESEWPDGDRNAECDRIAHGLGQILELAMAEYFSAPVDLSAFPTYAMVIEYPIDLSTIKARLENRFYRRITSIQFDVRYIETNAKKFNQPNSQIVKYAKLCTELCLRLIGDTGCTDAMLIYSELVQDVDFAVTPGTSRVQDDSDTDVDVEKPSSSKRGAAGSSAASKRKQANKKPNPDIWKDDCKQVLNMIFECEDAVPFRCAVDPIDYPEYYESIDTPMDLGTVREQLEVGAYDSPVEFCKDMRLVFNNSKAYNTNKKSRIYAMTLRLSAIFEDQFKDVLSDWKSAKKYEKTGRLPPGFKKRTSIVPPSSSSQPSTRSGGQSSSRRSNGPSASNLAHPSSSSGSGRTTRSHPKGNLPTGAATQSRPQRGGRQGTKRKHVSSDEEQKTKADSGSEDSDDSEFEVERLNTKNARSARRAKKPPPKKSAKKLVNGHNAGYSTRCRTGTIKRRHYDSEVTEEEEEEEEDESATTEGDSDSDAPQTRRSPRNKSKQTNGRVPSSRKPPSKRNKIEDNDEEDNDSSNDDDSDNDSDDSDDSSSSDSSEEEKKGGDGSSDTEDYSASEATPLVRTRSTRAANTRPKNKTQEVTPPSSSESRRTSSRVPKQRSRGDSYQSGGSSSRNTRNQGRRTVRYEEGSDNDYAFAMQQSDSDATEDEEETITVSSRGRVRKLTARAKAMLRD